MPEAVGAFFRCDEVAEGLMAAREIQRELNRSFMQDFAKHSGAENATHIAAVFEDVSMCPYIMRDMCLME